VLWLPRRRHGFANFYQSGICFIVSCSLLHGTLGQMQSRNSILVWGPWCNGHESEKVLQAGFTINIPIASTLVGCLEEFENMSLEKQALRILEASCTMKATYITYIPEIPQVRELCHREQDLDVRERDQNSSACCNMPHCPFLPSCAWWIELSPANHVQTLWLEDLWQKAILFPGQKEASTTLDYFDSCYCLDSSFGIDDSCISTWRL
jgi:hypothetical protein